MVQQKSNKKKKPLAKDDGGDVNSSNHNQIHINFNPTAKQSKAWIILEDKETNVLFYGGAAMLPEERHTSLVLGL